MSCKKIEERNGLLVGKSYSRAYISNIRINTFCNLIGQTMDGHSSYDSVKLKLNDKEFTFEDGKWNGEFSSGDIASLLKQNQDLIEENNFLKLKIEMLLNMVAEDLSKNETSDASQHKNPRL